MNETDFASYANDNTPYVQLSSKVLDLIQNLPLTLTLMTFARKQALN